METEKPHSADELGNYRALSTSAVVALVLGLLSPVAFVAPLMLLVPLMATVVAWWALAKIKGSQGGLSGARLAYGGLVLAVVFGVASVTRVQVRIEILRRQADHTARLWMSLLTQEHAEEALSLMTTPAIFDLSDPDRGVGAAPIFAAALNNAQLLQEPIAQALSAMRKRGNLELTLRKAQVLHELNQPRAALTYEGSISPGEQRLFELRLIKVDGSGDVNWLVGAWKTIRLGSPAEDQ